jgi:3-oxoacyl-[acyl-carrier-protein] synthase-3
VCMLGGGARGENGEVIAWKDLRLDKSMSQKFSMNIQQDIRQLRDRAPLLTMERPLSEIKKRRGLQPGDYAYFLPHISSHFFHDLTVQTMRKIDFVIPEERWFTSLYNRGNVGSAANFVAIDELLRTKPLARGDKILCFVPESARMSVYYYELEVV